MRGLTVAARHSPRIARGRPPPPMRMLTACPIGSVSALISALTSPGVICRRSDRAKYGRDTQIKEVTSSGSPGLDVEQLSRDPLIMGIARFWGFDAWQVAACS